jgi:hypothetical protein
MLPAASEPCRRPGVPPGARSAGFQPAGAVTVARSAGKIPWFPVFAAAWNEASTSHAHRSVLLHSEIDCSIVRPSSPGSSARLCRLEAGGPLSRQGCQARMPAVHWLWPTFSQLLPPGSGRLEAGDTLCRQRCRRSVGISSQLLPAPVMKCAQPASSRKTNTVEMWYTPRNLWPFGRATWNKGYSGTGAVCWRCL